ncbi:MAG: class I SAM-dependent methyltransferase [Caldisericia bacterium]|nr:class I SAM-dependent methyltransferase [Caldisericia bacterium]
MNDWCKEYFDSWYGELILDTIPPDMTEQQISLLMKLLDLTPHQKVIDLGCGKGRHALLLSKAGMHVTALDFCAAYLEELKKKSASEGLWLEILEQDMRLWKEKDTYDAAYMMFTSFGYFSDPENEKVILNVASSLKKKGRFVIDIENRDYILKFFIHEKWREKETGILLERHKFFPLSSVLSTKRILVNSTGEQKQSFRQYRLYSAHEIITLANKAGFDLRDSLGDYSGIPYQINSPRIIFGFQKR